jgi:C1A family cysteine protease
MKYGWNKDREDLRDHHYSLRLGVDEMQATLPDHIDLRCANMPPVYDQGQLGSCTANALCGGFEFSLRKQGLIDFMPSRLFVYYNERVLEGTPNEDAGAELRDGIKVLASQGVVKESEWAYVVEKFTEKPSAALYNEALENVAVQYQRINNSSLTQIKSCLAAGFPFVFGFTVFSGFESDAVAKTGKLEMPTQNEENLGGHAVMAVGYDDHTQRVIVRNSWGDRWGIGGYFTMPYSYITHAELASDFWTIRLVK